MFNDIIHVKNIKDIRFGHTDISFAKTYAEIMEVLEKHGCNQVMSMKDGELHKIAFVYQEKPYVTAIPRVYVKGVYNDRIGIRLVKYYLEIILEWSKQRIINFEFIMLGSRIVDINGQNVSLKDAVDVLPAADIFKPVTDKKLLKENVIDADFIVKEDEEEEP